MGQIYLIRHGQASFGSDNYDALSALGRQQGMVLGEWFAEQGQRFDRVLVGSMQRHRQTAAACMTALARSAPPETAWQLDPGFDEYDHHEVLIRHRPDFAEPGAVLRFLATQERPQQAYQAIHEAAVARWIGGGHDAQYGEPWPQFRRRCAEALQRLLESAAPAQNIAVFTSGGTIGCLCQGVLGLDDRHTAQLGWSFANSAVTKIFYRQGKLSLGYLNNYAHLEWRGQRAAVSYR